MHEIGVRWLLQRRRSRGDAFSAEAARARQAARTRRQHAALAGAALRPFVGQQQVPGVFKTPAGDGEPWKRVLRRAASEDEACRIFAQAEAALDTESQTPVGADVRASRPIRMLGEECLRDSIERGKQPRTMEQRESRLNAHILPTIGDVPVTKWRVEHSRRVMEKGGKMLFSRRGREDLRGQLATRERAIAAGRRIVVVTPTLKAAQVAEGAIGAASYSAAWLLHQHGFRWDEDGRWSRADSVPDVSARLRRGDLLVVDEAGMVDQDTARALLRLADETKALVILVGDRHQLPAVGRGGVLDLATRYAPDRVQQLDGVRRFKDPRYAELSLRMRTGARLGEVFDELLARKEIVIHTSDVERSRRLAAEASVGKLVVADTREHVARINTFAHRIRKATGEVDERVLTAAGERIGVGDTIATRRNDRDADVANRELWTVVASDRGTLTVRGEAGTRVLPPTYVRRDVELAYATTAYGAQGTTVAESHVLVGEHTGAASAYVGMTRGRERNVAHLVADSVEDARKQWCDVFGRDRADLGPAHAREAAAEAIERYGPMKPRYVRPSAPRPTKGMPRPDKDLGYRPPSVSSSGPDLGI